MPTARRLFRVSSIVSLLSLGCVFAPQVDWGSCNIPCEGGGGCPSGLICRPEDSGREYCVAPDFSRMCESEPEQPSPEDAGLHVPPTLEQPSPPDAGDGMPANTVITMTPPPVDACGRSGALVIEPCTLPPPCLGVPYEIALQVASGGAGRTWQVSANGGDPLAIDPITGVLSGVVTGKDGITLEVSVYDADAKAHGHARYTVQPRTSCWFAYPSAESGSRQVHLVDPILLDASPRHELPRALPAGASVEDFRFSPDGRWLAVRVDDAGARSVELFTAPSWESAGVIDAGGSVLEYAWSPNARVLALVAETPSGRTLGGVRVPSDPATGGGGVVALTPVATPIDPPLVWVGNGSVAFHAQDAADPVLHYLHSGVLADTAAQFSGVAAFTDLAYEIGGVVSLELVPSSSSFVAVSSDGLGHNLISYEVTTQGGPAMQASFLGDPVVSPTGAHLARAADGRLEIFRSDEYAEAEPVPSATALGCGRVLAWSGDDSRVACATGDASGSLRVFTRAGAQLTSELVEGDYEYPVQLQYRPRAFSARGGWFTFTTPFGLYSVDLGSEPLQQYGRGVRLDSVNAEAELAVSPDGEQLLVHSGQWLALRSLSQIETAHDITDSRLDPALRCNEDAWASPSGCGTARTRSSQLIWSPDSRVFAFRTEANQLLLHQTRPDATARSLSIACDGPCITSSEFQPFSF